MGELDAAGAAFTSVRKLTFDERPDYPLGWAPDGSGFLMKSSSLGDMDLFSRSLEVDGPELFQGGSGAPGSGAFSPEGHPSCVVGSFQENRFVFHSLDPEAGQVVDLVSGEKITISVEDWSSFEYVSWTAQGDGFFITAGFSGQTEFLAALVHVDMEGRAQRLLTLPSEWQAYVRASPDGRYVAFASMPFHGNVWLIEDPDLVQGR